MIRVHRANAAKELPLLRRQFDPFAGAMIAPFRTETSMQLSVARAICGRIVRAPMLVR
jgi:hypothetical protein